MDRQRLRIPDGLIRGNVETRKSPRLWEHSAEACPTNNAHKLREKEGESKQ
jgi:hypothetical protein